MTNLRQPYPILEHDPSPEAVIEPRKLVRPIGAPERCVICFFQEVINKLKRQKRLSAQMLYSGDDVSGAEWDRRGWSTRMPVRERLFWLAAEACLAL